MTGAGGASEGGAGAGTEGAGWIDGPAALHALVERLVRAPRLALDTEADGFTAYRPRLCLVQLAWEEPSGVATAIVDPLALEGRLGPLRAPLEDPALETIVSSTLKRSKRWAGSRYSASSRITRASALLRKSRLR